MPDYRSGAGTVWDERGGPTTGTAPPVMPFAQWATQNGYNFDADPSSRAGAEQAYAAYVAEAKDAAGPQVGAVGSTPVGTDKTQEAADARNAALRGVMNEQHGYIGDAIANVRGRTAPIAPNAAHVTGATLGPVAGPMAGTVDPYVAARSAVGARQMSLADMLQAAASDTGRGQLEVQNEIQRQRNSILGAAQTARPGQAGGMRAALQAIGGLEAGGASEAARRTAGYQDQARNALAGVLGQARSGDIAESGNEMNAINQARGLNAQLGTSTSIAGANLNAQQAALRAQLEQQAGIANAGYEQNAGQFGADLGLRSQAAQDQALNAYLAQNAGLLGLQQNGNLSADQIAAQERMQQQQLRGQWDIANLGSQTQLKLGDMNSPGWVTQALGAGLSIAAIVAMLAKANPKDTGGKVGGYAGAQAGADAGNYIYDPYAWGG